jgi:hypothetical protein
MFARRHICALAISVAAALAYYSLVGAQTAKPLDEKDIVRMIDLGLDGPKIIANLQKEGITFVADDAVLDRLKKAGASDAVIESVRKAGEKKPAKEPAGGAKAVTYEDVLDLLRYGEKESDILERLKKSPTIFTLGDDQVDELKKAGASAKLLEAMQRRPSTSPGGEVTDLAIILDCSGSMNERTKDGKTKMDVARRVVADLIKDIPLGLDLAFIIYGHDSSEKCQAVKVVRPLSPLDNVGRNVLINTVKNLPAVGATPIALALRTAGQELASAKGPCGLILISDGKETCHGKPTEETARLAKELNLSFGVNVIGFDVQADEREALEEIARAGKGKYYNAANAAEFRKAVMALHKKLDEVAKPASPPKAHAAVAKAPTKPMRRQIARRTVKFLPPEIQLPPMKRIVVTWEGKPGPPSSEDFSGGFIRLPGQLYIGSLPDRTPPLGQAGYGREFILPSADKVDIWWQPMEGVPVVMIRGFSIGEPGTVEVRPEQYLGVVRVRGEGRPRPKFVVLTRAGGDGYVQVAKEYGKDMVVPVGKYDLWVKPVEGLAEEKLQSGFEVTPGEILEIE